MELRADLKDPFGPVYTDTAALLADTGSPLVAVGDIVTYHLLGADCVPDVALVDERTERSAVDADVTDAISGFHRRVAVRNPAGTLTRELVAALREGLDSDGTTLIDVDGEEDLAALPAVLAVGEDASVVYGQPGEGMVLVTPDAATRERVYEILAAMDGESEWVCSALD